MGKAQKSNKESKKQPLLTAKEKRAAKKLKQDEKPGAMNFSNNSAQKK